MITLRDAVNTAKNTMTDARALHKECYDTGDTWIFTWYFKDNPDELRLGGAGDIEVYKADGKTNEFFVGVPGDESWDKLENASKVNISDYV